MNQFSNQHKSSTKSESSIPVDRLVLRKKGQKRSCTKESGERGIRTPGTLRHTGFRDRHIRPLCHLSG